MSEKSVRRPKGGTLDLQRVRDLVSYDPVTGLFRHRIDARRRKLGAIAGSAHNAGYIQTRVDNVSLVAHRLAWFYMTGSWPKQLLDHINGNRSDNRWVNLREATPQQNNHNTHVCRSSTGYVGVYLDKRYGTFKAQIKTNNKLLELGRFKTAEAASAAYLAAKRILHPFHSMFL